MGFNKKKDFSNMSRKEIYDAALAKVYRSVSVSEQSSKKIFEKLTSQGYPQDVIDDVIEQSFRIGAIDDVRYSNCLIRSTLSAGKGLSFAKKEIEELGIDIEELEAYQEFLEEGDDLLLNNALDFLRRHTPRSKDLRGSSYRRLINKGYSSDIASRASRLFVEECRIINNQN